MARLTVNKDCLAVAVELGVHIFVFKDSANLFLELPAGIEGNADGETPSTKPTDLDVKNTVLGIQLSQCGNWLCGFSSRKQLILWETRNWSVVSSRSMPKVACSLAFTQDCKRVVIVDKSGDALLFSIDDFGSESKLILGHLSMLLDVVISSDDKFIVTSDRDEKIRVSHFPNAYNIAAYCLGHKEFVSSLCLLKHNPSILVSGSGDGTVCLWDYVKGSSLTTYNCSEDVIQKLKLESTDDCDHSLIIPIEKIRCGFKDVNCSLLAVLFYRAHGFLVYRVHNRVLEFLEALCVKDDVFDVSFGEQGELWAFTSDRKCPIKCFSYNEETGTFSVPSQYDSLMRKTSETLLPTLPLENSSCQSVPQLFKRKFENVKDYYEQKKARRGD